MRLLPMVLAWGCAPCPTFDQIEVSTPEGPAVDAFAAEVGVAPTEVGDILASLVTDALDQFAAATERDGVCVGQITWVQDLATVPGVPEPEAGYRSEGRRILLPVNNQFDQGAVTWRALCRALDEREGLSAANPDLFSSEEAFEEACGAGPADIGRAVALEDTCGIEGIGDRARFLAEVVYPGVQPDPVPMGADDSIELLPLEIGPARLFDATGAHGRIALLLRGARTSEHLVLLDPVTGRTTSLELPIASGAKEPGPRFLHADEGLWIEAPARSGRGVRWDGKGFFPFDLGLVGDEGLLLGAVSEGTLYGVVSYASDAWRAYDLASGTYVSLSDERNFLVGVSSVVGAWPSAGGFEVGFGRLFTLYEHGERRIVELPWASIGRVDPKDGTHLFLSASHDRGAFLLRHHLADDTFTAEPRCDAEIGQSARLVDVDGEPWLVDPVDDGAGGTIVRYGPL